MGGTAGLAFKLQKPPQMRVPRPCVGEKGGYDDGIHNGRCRTDKSCAGSIAAHPCKKRKDGAPSVGMVQCKDGPPADPNANAYI